MGEFLGICMSPGGRLHRHARRLGLLVAGPLRLLDAWLDRHPRAELIASGVYAIARR